VNGHLDTGTSDLAFNSGDHHSNHTACESCHNCLAHRLPLVVRGYCRITLEDALCEVGRSECFSADITRSLANTHNESHQVGISVSNFQCPLVPCVNLVCDLNIAANVYLGGCCRTKLKRCVTPDQIKPTLPRGIPTTLSTTRMYT
jgi:hypothetical protein